MDTVTQMLLGATVAQAGFRRRLGRRALAVGAAVALLPDLDSIVGWVAGPFAGWLYHRGLTHSIFFGPLAGLLIGWLVWAWHRRRYGPDSPWVADGALRAWCGLSILALITHPIIDVFTHYGTQWLYPLTDTRFAIPAMPIIDPVYSLILIAAIGVGLVVRRRAQLAQDTAAVALLLVAAYTLGGWAMNSRVESVARAQLGPSANVSAYPTLFQPFLRRVVVEQPDAIWIGFHSVLSQRDIVWQRFERNSSPAIKAVAATRRAQIFDWFAMERVYWRQQRLDDGAVRVQALDYRYGLPGDSVLGIWGIQATVDAHGTRVGPVEQFSPPQDTSAAAWRDFWRRIIGAAPGG